MIKKETNYQLINNIIIKTKKQILQFSTSANSYNIDQNDIDHSLK